MHTLFLCTSTFFAISRPIEVKKSFPEYFFTQEEDKIFTEINDLLEPQLYWAKQLYGNLYFHHKLKEFKWRIKSICSEITRLCEQQINCSLMFIDEIHKDSKRNDFPSQTFLGVYLFTRQIILKNEGMSYITLIFIGSCLQNSYYKHFLRMFGCLNLFITIINILDIEDKVLKLNTNHKNEKLASTIDTINGTIIDYKTETKYEQFNQNQQQENDTQKQEKQKVKYRLFNIYLRKNENTNQKVSSPEFIYLINTKILPYIRNQINDIIIFDYDFSFSDSINQYVKLKGYVLAYFIQMLKEISKEKILVLFQIKQHQQNIKTYSLNTNKSDMFQLINFQNQFLQNGLNLKSQQNSKQCNKSNMLLNVNFENSFEIYRSIKLSLVSLCQFMNFRKVINQKQSNFKFHPSPIFCKFIEKDIQLINNPFYKIKDYLKIVQVREKISSFLQREGEQNISQFIQQKQSQKSQKNSIQALSQKQLNQIKVIDIQKNVNNLVQSTKKNTQTNTLSLLQDSNQMFTNTFQTSNTTIQNKLCNFIYDSNPTINKNYDNIININEKFNKIEEEKEYDVVNLQEFQQKLLSKSRLKSKKVKKHIIKQINRRNILGNSIQYKEFQIQDESEHIILNDRNNLQSEKYMNKRNYNKYESEQYNFTEISEDEINIQNNNQQFMNPQLFQNLNNQQNNNIKQNIQQINNKFNHVNNKLSNNKLNSFNSANSKQQNKNLFTNETKNILNNSVNTFNKQAYINNNSYFSFNSLVNLNTQNESYFDQIKLKNLQNYTKQNQEELFQNQISVYSGLRTATYIQMQQLIKASKLSQQQYIQYIHEYQQLQKVNQIKTKFSPFYFDSIYHLYWGKICKLELINEKEFGLKIFLFDESAQYIIQYVQNETNDCVDKIKMVIYFFNVKSQNHYKNYILRQITSNQSEKQLFLCSLLNYKEKNQTVSFKQISDCDELQISKNETIRQIKNAKAYISKMQERVDLIQKQFTYNITNTQSQPSQIQVENNPQYENMKQNENKQQDNENKVDVKRIMTELDEFNQKINQLEIQKQNLESQIQYILSKQIPLQRLCIEESTIIETDTHIYKFFGKLKNIRLFQSSVQKIETNLIIRITKYQRNIQLCNIIEIIDAKCLQTIISQQQNKMNNQNISQIQIQNQQLINKNQVKNLSQQNQKGRFGASGFYLNEQIYIYNGMSSQFKEETSMIVFNLNKSKQNIKQDQNDQIPQCNKINETFNSSEDDSIYYYRIQKFAISKVSSHGNQCHIILPSIQDNVKHIQVDQQKAFSKKYINFKQRIEIQNKSNHLIFVTFESIDYQCNLQKQYIKFDFFDMNEKKLVDELKISLLNAIQTVNNNQNQITSLVNLQQFFMNPYKQFIEIGNRNNQINECYYELDNQLYYSLVTQDKRDNNQFIQTIINITQISQFFYTKPYTGTLQGIINISIFKPF